jgi:hypothetical protein
MNLSKEGPVMRAIITFFLSTASVLAFSAQTVSVEVFSSGSHPFRVVSTPSGINCPDDSCEAKFRQNTTIVLTAVPDLPFEDPSLFFVEWGGDCSDISPTCTISEQGNFSVTAKIPLAYIQNAYSPSRVLQPGDPDWPVPRYYDQYSDDFGYDSGFIDDFLTGIRWMEDANCMQTHYPELDTGAYSQGPGDPNEYVDYPGDGAVDWPNALSFMDGVNSGNYNACTPDFYDECINQGGVWALPTKDELESLVDERFVSPMISNGVSDAQATEGDPFLNVSSAAYWSSTPHVVDPALDLNEVWVVSVDDGSVEQTGTDVGAGFHPVWLVCKQPAN